MSIFGAILNLLKSRESSGDPLSDKEREALRQAWGMDANDPVDDHPEPAREVTDPTGITYDGLMWRKKIARMVIEPAEIGRENFQAHLAEIWNESHALGLSPEAIFETAKTAFRNAVRHVVADRVITQAEHRYLENLQETFGLPGEMAARITQEVITEAETIFAAKIENG